jgi:predicted choloylglycine hydrolase
MALDFKEHIVHKQEGDFSLVKNIQLFGTNEEIGFKLGEIAKINHSISKLKNIDVIKNNCQKIYIKANYPIHYQRMTGLAKAYGEDINKTSFDFTCFGNPLANNACSAVYYPPRFTKNKTGILSRNADLPLTSFSEIITGKKDSDENPAASNIYITELYPDKGYSSLIVLSFELFGLGLDGINSEGLAVTHLHADTINTNNYKPTLEYGVGINEMLTVQFLLDNCKTVEDAKELLLCNKHYYMLLPLHFLIADRFGNSFIWEYSPQHNKEFIINSNNEIQIITNFPIHQYQNPANFPENEDKSCPFERYKTIKQATETDELISIEQIKKINSKVFIQDKMFLTKQKEPVRTIYHNLYDTTKKSMEISFYRKDVGEKQLRTDYYKFMLK